MTKFKLQVSIDVEIEMGDLRPDGEFQFVAQCLRAPGNSNGNLSEEENRAYFSRMWRAQIQIQEALLASPDALSRFLRYIALNEIADSGFITGRRAVAPEPLEDAIRPAVEWLGEESYFYPAIGANLDTYTLVQDFMDTIKPQCAEAVVTILEATTEGRLPIPLLTSGSVTTRGQEIKA